MKANWSIKKFSPGSKFGIWTWIELGSTKSEKIDDIQSLLPRKFNEMENSNDENDSLLDDNFEHKNDKYSFAEEITEEETLSLQDKELELIIKALERNNGRRKAAAKELGISERTLYRKINEYGINKKYKDSWKIKLF